MQTQTTHRSVLSSVFNLIKHEGVSIEYLSASASALFLFLFRQLHFIKA